MEICDIGAGGHMSMVWDIDEIKEMLVNMQESFLS